MRYQYHISTEEFYNPLIYRYDCIEKRLEYWYNGEWNLSVGGVAGHIISGEKALRYITMQELVE